MSQQGPVLGIDLGTTNSVVAVADGKSVRVIADPDGHRLIPSVVSFTSDGVILVGTPARERRLVDAANTVYSVKRLIGRPFASPEVQRAKERLAFKMSASKTGGVQVDVRKGTYALAEISAMVLRHIRKVAEADLDEECSKAVVTVPANFNELQRSATQAAGKVAGLDVLRILNEPTAATLAYGYGKSKPERVAVYDLGGGTFDFTLLELDGDVFEVVGTAGDTFLGGDDIDLLVAERMSEACLAQHRFDPRADPQCFERLRAAGEWAKCQLTMVEEAELTLEELFVDGSGRTMDFAFQMRREELEQRSRPILARSFDVVNEVLRESGKRPKEVDSVVLVGGSTRMPLVRQMVQDFFGKAPRVDIDPDLVVAQGAALHAWTLAGKPRASAKKPTSQLGRVALRKITVAEVRKKPKQSALVEEVAAPRARIPKQPAFAPDHPDDDLMRHIPVAQLAAPVAVGEKGDSGLLVLDDPTQAAELEAQPTTVKRSPRKVTMGGLGDRAPIEAPAMDAPFGEEPLPLPEPVRRRDPRAEVDDAPARRVDPRMELDEPPATRFDPRAPPAKEPPPPVAPMPPTPPQRRPPPPPPRAAPRPPPPPEPAPPEPAPAWGAALLDDGGFDAPPPAPAPQAAWGDLQSAGIPPAMAATLAAAAPVDAKVQAAGPAPAPRIPELKLSDAPTPLLMDVTPLSIGLETAGGFCQHLIPRGAPVPAERTRTFSTARDDQDAVEVRIAQGESMRFGENELLGTLVLEGIRTGPRGNVRIDVSFLVDASGVLDVKAVDVDTKREQTTRIDLQGGIEAAEIEAMRRRQESEMA